MNGLVSSPVALPDPEGQTVAADGWFPPIAPAMVRATARLGDGAVTNDRIVAAIEGAMLTALRQLAEWRTARVLAGAANLAGVTDQQLAGRNHAVVLWERIIRYLAAAELAGGHRDISATDQGLDRAQEKDQSADEYHRLAWAAVADLSSIGGPVVPRNRVDLI